MNSGSNKEPGYEDFINSFSHVRKQGQNMPPLINKFIKQIINRQD